MSVTIRGTDNSASTPAVTGTDGDTGVFFPATNQVALATNGTQALLVDASQRVGVGISSPTSILHVAGANSTQQFRVDVTGGASGVGISADSINGNAILYGGNDNLRFVNVSLERMRINSNGDIIINSTSGNGACKLNVNGNIFQAPSYSGNFTGGWQNVVNIDTTFGGSSGRIRVHANENGNNNVSYGEWFYVTSAAGPQISAQGQVTSGNAFGTAQLRMSGATLQIQNALGGAIGSWKVTFEIYVG